MWKWRKGKRHIPDALRMAETMSGSQYVCHFFHNPWPAEWQLGVAMWLQPQQWDICENVVQELLETFLNKQQASAPHRFSLFLTGRNAGVMGSSRVAILDQEESLGMEAHMEPLERRSSNRWRMDNTGWRLVCYTSKVAITEEKRKERSVRWAELLTIHLQILM